VNLHDPRSDLLVTQIDNIARRGSPGARPYGLPHRRLVCPPRSYALPADLATRRCRLPRSVARNQNRICEVFACRRVTITGDGQPRRTGHLAAAVLEHTIRDDRDVAAHMDYTHFNPVKHGLVSTRRIGRIRRFVGAWMAACIPTDGEAAVINRTRQASGLEIQARGQAGG
jgi:hypothetical protein